MQQAALSVGVLDFFETLAQTMALAPALEALGYTRFWVADHPPQPNPILVAGLVANVTQRIRVGTAGILFPFYSPARAAHDFQLLNAAYPDRVDAGFCPRAGGPARLAPDLWDGRTKPDEATAHSRVAALIRYLRATPETHPADVDETVWSGALYQPPAIWVHGNGPGSAAIAAAQGIGLSVSLFHPQGAVEPRSVAAYRAQFQVRGALLQPRVAVTIAGVCASTTTQAQALWQATPHPDVIPTVVGTPAQWLAAIEAVRARFAPDDLIILDLCPSLAERLTCYRLLAEALDLPADSGG